MATILERKVDSSIIDDSERCSVCLEDFNHGEIIYGHKGKENGLLVHFMHNECSQLNLNYHKVCPICRCELDKNSHPRIYEVQEKVLQIIENLVFPAVYHASTHRIGWVGLAMGGAFLSSHLISGESQSLWVSLAALIMMFGLINYESISQKNRVNCFSLTSFTEILRNQLPSYLSEEMGKSVDIFLKFVGGAIVAQQITNVPMEAVKAIDCKQIVNKVKNSEVFGSLLHKGDLENFIIEKTKEVMGKQIEKVKAVTGRALFVGAAASALTVFLGAPVGALALVAPISTLLAYTRFFPNHFSR